MNCETCAQAPCVCAAIASTTPVFRSTYQEIPFGITKEEFGLALFEAVKTASALGWCRRHATNRVAQLTATLTGLLPQITDPADLRRILHLSQGPGG